jgi:hypothetical protein
VFLTSLQNKQATVCCKPFLDLSDIFSLCLNRQDDQTVGKGCSDVTRSKEKTK